MAAGGAPGGEAGMSREVAILGVGMHPWGKWGKNFVEYGVKAARDAHQRCRASSGKTYNSFLAATPSATATQATSPARLSAKRWAGVVPGSRARTELVLPGSQAINNARSQILAGMCDVALVVGADAAPKGFFAPTGGDRPDDPDWLRFRLLGATNPIYFGLYARRRMEAFGATSSTTSRR